MGSSIMARLGDSIYSSGVPVVRNMRTMREERISAFRNMDGADLL